MASESSEIKILKDRIKELENENKELREELKRAFPGGAFNAKAPIINGYSREGLLGTGFRSRDNDSTSEIERELKESELRYSSLIEKLPGIVHILSIHNLKQVTYISQQVKSILGYDPEDFILDPEFFSGILHPEDRKMLEESASRFEISKGEITFEFRLFAKDGRLVWFRDDLKVVCSPSGEPRYIQGIMTDITARKNIQRKLEESEELYRTIVELSPNSIGIHVEDRLVFINSAGARLLGAGNTESIIGKSLRDFIPEDHMIRIDEKRSKAAVGQKYETCEIKVISLDGREHYLESFAQKMNYRGKPAVLFAARDISEQKKTQQALEESEKKYRSVFENAVEGIFQIIPGGRIKSVNPAMAAMLGYDSPEELIGQVIDIWKQIIVRPRNRMKVIARLREQGEIKGHEVQVRKRNGETIWLSSSIRIEKGPSNEVVYYEGIVEDITARKEYEAKLKMTQFSVDKASPAIFWVKPDAGLYYVNDKACSMLGYSREELLQMSVYDFDPNYPQEKSLELFDKIRKEGYYYLESFIRDSKGSIIPIDLHFNYYYYNRSEFYVAYVSDITSRKAAEDAIIKNEQRYRTLIEQASDGIFLTDSNGNLIDVNSGGCKMTGYTREELTSMNIADLIEKKELTAWPLRLDIISGTKTHLNERTIRKRSGELLAVEVSSTCLENGNIQGIVRDITERKKYEQELLKSREELRLLAAHLETVREEERTSIAREVHDELGQSLTALKLLALSIKKRIPAESFGVISRLEEMTEIISNTLSSVKSLLAKLRPEVLDTLGLLPAIEWLTAEYSNKTGIDVNLIISCRHLRFGPDISIVIFRILQEALTNISKHAEAEKVTVKLYRKNKILTLTIKDDGKGFDYESINRNVSFGLTGMQERAYIAGGMLGIKSNTGLGTVLTLKIPEEKLNS